MKFLTLSFLILAACQSRSAEVADFASSRVATDFASYRLQRVGLFPFLGENLSAEDSKHLQASFYTEVSNLAPFDVVPLDLTDLAEIPTSDPFRRGVYKPHTVIDVARRFHLDAIFVGTVTDRQLYLPQRIGLQLDMVAAETGMVIWGGSVNLDGSQERVRRGVEAWAQGRQDDLSDMDWNLCLVSPRRFSQFATYQLARQLAE